MMRKGFVHADYVVAIGIFIAMFGIAIFYLNGYMVQIKDEADSAQLINNAYYLLEMADYEGIPDRWPEITADNTTTLLLHFNENNTGAGGIVDSARGNNGTALLNPFFNMSCRFGTCWTYHSLEYLSFPFNGSWSFGSNPFTIELWAKFNSSNDHAFISASDGLGSNEWALLYEDGYLEFMANSPGNGLSYPVRYGWLPDPNSWNHIAVTRANSSYILYINGNIVNRGTDSSQIIINGGPLNIGALGNRYLLNGSIDEVVIYNRSLESWEMEAHGKQESRLERLGLISKIMSFYIEVNNSFDFLYNKSNIGPLANETVSFNLTQISREANPKSVKIYDESGNSVNYMIYGSNISFLVGSLDVNSTKWFLAYFDYYKSGYFPDSSVSVSGNDSVRETLMAPTDVEVLDSHKISNLARSNYSALKERMGIGEFRISLFDMQLGSIYMALGESAPRRGDVTALQRFHIFQNETGAIRPGRLTVQVW